MLAVLHKHLECVRTIIEFFGEILFSIDGLRNRAIRYVRGEGRGDIALLIETAFFWLESDVSVYS